jgi:hypothetical protein
MALVKATLQAELVSMLNEMTSETDQATGIQNFAGKLATAIDNYIKTATVTVAFPIPVQVAVPAGTGGTTAAGTGTLS